METAGMMYGVSMGADGTSKVICQRLEADERVPATEPADAEPVSSAGSGAIDVPDAEPVH
jgi:hypothetical protein